MPELPDVEAARQSAAQHVGAEILDVAVADASVLRNATPSQVRRAWRARRLAAARRHGKWLTIDTTGPSLVIHLGMTGQLQWCAPDVEPDRFERLRLHTDSGDLRFADRRKLGGVWLARTSAEIDDLYAGLGPDAATITCADLRARLERTSRPVKVALMDQALVAGLGNMLSDEVLWRAHLHPLTPANDLTAKESGQLCRALTTALRQSVRAGRIPRTKRWLSSQRAAEAPACPRCAAPLEWSRVNGRSALWCPRCQPPDRPVC
jgi:formamidopyrimidine-DNA glycosylase